jgi:hypothetical protein
VITVSVILLLLGVLRFAFETLTNLVIEGVVPPVKDWWS